MIIDEFSRFHPAVNIIFYVSVLGITMFQMQAGLILISLLGAVTYHLILKGMEGMKYIGMVLVVMLASAVFNPLFSHKGGTLLFYLFGRNPVTLESLIYGVAVAEIIGAMLLWFSTFHVIMTEDKLLAGIGSFMPHVATLLSMIFRFVPKLVKHGHQVEEATRALEGKPVGMKKRLKTNLEIFSSTATWALENSVDTADSMRARGYGVGRRTYFHNYRMTGRDIGTVAWILILVTIICIQFFMGNIFTYYYPLIQIRGNAGVYIMYTLLCFTPVLIDLLEAFRWHRLKSKI